MGLINGALTRVDAELVEALVVRLVPRLAVDRAIRFRDSSVIDELEAKVRLEDMLPTPEELLVLEEFPLDELPFDELPPFDELLYSFDDPVLLSEQFEPVDLLGRLFFSLFPDSFGSALRFFEVALVT